MEHNTFHNKMKFIITDLKKIEIQPPKCTKAAFIVVLVKANEFRSQLLGTLSDIRKISKEQGEKIDGKLQPLYVADSGSAGRKEPGEGGGAAEQGLPGELPSPGGQRVEGGSQAAAPN